MFFILKSCPKKTLDMTSRSLVGVLLPWCWLPPNSLPYSFVQGFSNELHIHTTMHSKFRTDNLSEWHQYSCTLNRVNVKILSNIQMRILHIFEESVKILGKIFSKFLVVDIFIIIIFNLFIFLFMDQLLLPHLLKKKKKKKCTWDQNLDILEVPLILSPNLSVGSLGGGGQPEVWSCFEFGLLPIRHNETL